ncbi:hypothetical protein F4778DRAFT_776851 [Xylariomycetidae sp. FL2044]|nr:hypothetical protein F4778DRAFT_776851 [Xylariomycetidae sp. FL2044]
MARFFAAILAVVAMFQLAAAVPYYPLANGTVPEVAPTPTASAASFLKAPVTEDAPIARISASQTRKGLPAPSPGPCVRPRVGTFD